MYLGCRPDRVGGAEAPVGAADHPRARVGAVSFLGVGRATSLAGATHARVGAGRVLQGGAAALLAVHAAARRVFDRCDRRGPPDQPGDGGYLTLAAADDGPPGAA